MPADDSREDSVSTIQLKTFSQLWAQRKAGIQGIFSGATFVNRSLVLTTAFVDTLQLADIHTQIAKLLRAYSIRDCRGPLLVRRALDYGIRPYPASKSRGKVQFGDETYPTQYTGTLSAGYAPGASSITLNSGHNFGSLVAPFGQLLLSRGTVNEERRAILSIVGNVITFSSPTTKTHTVSTSVYLSTSGGDRNIPAGTVCSVPGLLGTSDIDFITVSDVVLYDGDVLTETVDVVSVNTGLGTVVGAGRIAKLPTPPFSGATVNNPLKTSGGRSTESDEELLARIDKYISSLARGTPVALENAVINLTEGLDTITRARAVEPVGMGATLLYVDNGAGSLNYGATSNVRDEALVLSAAATRQFARLARWPIVRGVTPVLHLSAEHNVATAIGTNSLTDAGASWTVNQWAGYRVVDDQEAYWTILSNTATTLTLTPLFGGPTTPSLGVYAIYDPGSSLTLFDAANLPITQPTAAEDLIFSYTTGHLQLNPLAYPSGMSEYQALIVSTYQYTTGVMREAARVVHGDPINRDVYPGVRAAGTYVELVLPTIRSLLFTISIRAAQGYIESELYPLVRDAVVQYVNSRDLGDTVYLSELVRRIKSITGILDVTILSPVTNPVLFEYEIPSTDSSLIGVV